MSGRKSAVVEFEGRKYRARGITAANIKEGNIIVHLDGTPQRVTFAGAHKDGFGWAYDFGFGDGIVPFAARGCEVFKLLVPVPEVGDGASVRVGSDVYPYTVTKVSETGHRIGLRRCEATMIEGSAGSEHQVYEYSEVPEYPTRWANWAPTKGRYFLSGAPVSVGVRRYYQDPSY